MTYFDKPTSRVIVLVACATALALSAGAGGAVAGSLITSADIQDKAVHTVDLAKDAVETQKVEDGTLGMKDLDESTQNKIATGVGPQGPQGPKGEPGVSGAYFSVAYYNGGTTNAGAIATVACKAQTDSAISGGVQVLGLDAEANSRNVPVSSSFPGRMDFSATPPGPKAHRLDGWIVQFGGTPGPLPHKNPEKVKVWALCVPNASIPVEQTYQEVN